MNLLFTRMGDKYFSWVLLSLADIIGILGWIGTAEVESQPNDCVECHQTLNPTMVLAWRESRHGAKGVGCIACHGDDHSNMFAVKGQVSAGVCGTCHPNQVKEFGESLHSVAMDTMKADPKFKRLSPVMAEVGCVGCHKIGTHFPDGSRGLCNSCHSGHSFSTMEARRPEACGQCHSGPDHPQMEAWQASKHGQLFASEATRAQAPTCVTCHMPKGSHNTRVGLTLGTVANGASFDNAPMAVKMPRLTAEESQQQRGLMLQTCEPCHSSRFSAESLTKADQVKLEADGLLAQGARIIGRLHADGLLQEAASTNSSGQIVLGGDQIYDGLSPIERYFFEMAKFHHATTFKGAYHHSPMHVHNLGFLRMKQDLDAIEHEAARVRKEAQKAKPEMAPLNQKP